MGGPLQVVGADGCVPPFSLQDHVLWIKKLYDEIEDASFRKKKDKVRVMLYPAWLCVCLLTLMIRVTVCLLCVE